MDKTAFMARYGGIYEHAPWVADAAWEQGMDGSEPLAMIDPMRLIVDRAGRDRQLTLLRAHPDLAGKLALAKDLTAESAAEQAGAGLDQCSPDELAEFQSLNDAYKDCFRFPFILAVKGHDRSSILQAFRKRLQNSPMREFRAALEQVHLIAKYRLKALTESSS